MSKKQEYEFKYPIDQDLCIKHKLATRIWKGIQDENVKMQTCECCGRKVGEQQVDSKCCYSQHQLSFLGVGVPLFFSYLRNSIILLIILSLIFCVFGIYTNVTSSDCVKDPSCAQNIFNTLSIVNKKNQDSYLSIQNYILLCFVIVCIALFQVFRYGFRKVELECDECLNSPSDYSIIIKRLPSQTVKQDIYDMIDERRGFIDNKQRQATNNLKVVNVILSYNMTYYCRKKDRYLAEFKEKIKQGESATHTVPDLPLLNQPAFIAIVVFERQQSKQLFLQKPSIIQRGIHFFFSACSPLSDYEVAGKRICIERAPQPDDIFWENADITVCQGTCRKMFFGAISLIILCLGGAAQYGLAIVQTNIADQTIKTLVGTASSVAVSITNAIIQYLLVYLTFYERMSTVTEYMDVLSTKLAFLQFLNAGIFVVGANILADYENFDLYNHFAQNVTQIMILNSITPVITTFVLYKWDISGKIFRYLRIKKQCCMVVTQLEANKLFQLPAAQIPYKYGYIIKTVWLTAFYAPFVPIVVPISICGMVFYYCVEKKLFGGSYSAPNMISSIVNWKCVELFEYVPLILCLGQFLVYLYFKHFRFDDVPVNWSFPLYLSITISILSLFLPTQYLNKLMCKMKQDLSEEPNYKDVQNQFQVTYEMTNPAIKTNRQRKRDVYIWKLLFGHCPGQKLQLGNNILNYNNEDTFSPNQFTYPKNYNPMDEQSISTDRENRNINHPLLNNSYPVPMQNQPYGVAGFQAMNTNMNNNYNPNQYQRQQKNNYF